MTATKPMLAKSEEELPLGDGWRYEPKWDGFRAIVTRDGDGVRIDSRGDRPLGRYFPELVELLSVQPAATYVMDGEIVMIANGVMDFETLQLRLHPAASRVNKLAGEIPATLVAFDLLELDGRDVRPLATDERRAELEGLIERLGAELAPDSPGGLHPGPALILTPQTADPDVARRWFADVDGVGQDGIVAKRAEQRYVEGERVMVKVKHHRTADCVVGGYRVERNGDGVGSLLLGLYDDEGRLQYVGHTSAFRAKERRELRETLEPLVGGGASGEGRSPGAAPAVGAAAATPSGSRSNRSSSARFATSACKAAGSAIRRAFSAGAPTAIRRAARSSSWRWARASSALRRFDGWTLGGSLSAFGKCGGHGASPSPPASSRAASSNSPSRLDRSVGSAPAPGSPIDASRSGTVRIVKSDGSTSGTSSQVSGVATRASGTGRTEYTEATVRSRVLVVVDEHAVALLLPPRRGRDAGRPACHLAPTPELPDARS